MKRLVAVMICAVMLCGFITSAPAESKYSRNIFGYFDTVTTIMAYVNTQEEFDRICVLAENEMDDLHKLFDGYNSYSGLHNLWYLNQYAAKEPVQVEEPLFDLLLRCRDMQAEYSKVNIAMGSVLVLWHNARETGVLPQPDALQAAAQHTDFSDVILDEENRTVFYADPELKLDLGAVAKGYAADRIQSLVTPHCPSFLISLGGNIYAGDPPLDGRKKWGVSIQCPDGVMPMQFGTDRVEVLYVRNLSVVTSGDYQRYMTVDGVRYHHLIDPATHMPATHLRAVTVICESGFQADFFSTLLFLLPYEEGMALVQDTPGVEALFILADGSIHLSPGLEEMALSHGASAR